MRENAFVPVYKQCNQGTIQEKWAAYQQPEGIRLPRYIDVELTNHCNFHCLMCPTGTGESKRTRGFMSDEVIEKVIENAVTYKIPVRLIGWGEPTLHPKFMHFVRELKKHHVLLHFNTNGSLLEDVDYREIVDLGVESLKFSFQGVDSQTYGEMRDGGDFERLIERINVLNQIRGERPYPYIQITTTITNESEEQVDKFKQLIAPYCDYYNIGRTKLSHLDQDKMTLPPEKKKKYQELLTRESVHKVPASKYCVELYDKLTVGWDGRVSACCTDTEYELTVGNIIHEDLQQIFNGDCVNQLRKTAASQDLSVIPKCRKCFGFIELR